MENIFIPESSMDVLDCPLNFNDGPGTYVNVNLNSENLEDNRNQIPSVISLDDQQSDDRVFKAGFMVQFCKIHCTSCNKHLGSAPNNQNDRYVHPLLNVLICKSCFDFYVSGEFQTDVDGSEQYCRWCGQGGKVICCSKCTFVFCLKCIRQNVGTRMIAKIKTLDDWFCFVCDKKQINRLTFICRRLYEFTISEREIAKTSNNPSILNKDHTICCIKNDGKRKLDVFQFTDKPRKKQKGFNVYKRVESNTNGNILLPEDNNEVVCTPDVSSFVSFNSVHTVDGDVRNTPNRSYRSKNNGKRKKILVVKNGVPPPLTPLSLPILSPSVPPLIPLPNEIRQNSATKVFVQNPLSNISALANRQMILLQNDWFLKVKREVIDGFNKLSYQLNELTKKKLQAHSISEMTNLHNTLQELLSASINNFYAIRRNLKTNFLHDITGTSFSNGKGQVSPNEVVNLKETLIPTRLISLKPTLTPNEVKKTLFKPRIKVKTVAELSHVPTECIVIPDDIGSEKQFANNNKDNDDVISIEDNAYEIIESDNENDIIIINDKPSAVNESGGNDDVTTIHNMQSKISAEKTFINEETSILPSCSRKDLDEKLTLLKHNVEAKNIFDPSTIRLIKYALLESNIDQLIQGSVNYQHLPISEKQFKKMISVKCLLRTNYFPGTVRTYPKKFYKPMNLKRYKKENSLSELKTLWKYKAIAKNVSNNVNLYYLKNTTIEANCNNKNNEDDENDRNFEKTDGIKNFVNKVIDDLQEENVKNAVTKFDGLDDDCRNENKGQEKNKDNNVESLSANLDKNKKLDETIACKSLENQDITQANCQNTIEINDENNSDEIDRNKIQVIDVGKTKNLHEVSTKENEKIQESHKNNTQNDENETRENNEENYLVPINENILRIDDDILEDDVEINSNYNNDQMLDDVNEEEEMNENADIEDFLGGSIVLKNITAVNEIESIFSKYGINNEPKVIFPDDKTRSSNNEVGK